MMPWRRHSAGLVFSCVFVVSFFTNKFVLSVLNFTFPTLFQGWQTLIGAVLLLLSGRLGLVEMSRITRSAALSWLPGALLFVGNIYAGSRALARLDIPLFFTLQNSSHVVSLLILKVVHRERVQRLKLFSLTCLICQHGGGGAYDLYCSQSAGGALNVFAFVCLMLLSAINLLQYDPQFDSRGYLWAVAHLFCVGAYRVFQVHYRPGNLSDLEQQVINYLFSVLLLAVAAHPTGDLMGALEFPSLQSHTFHCGCCASALLGFLLLLATVKLKSGLSVEHAGVWIFLSKVSAVCLSPFIFHMDVNTPSLICVLVSHVGGALLLYSDADSQTR